MMIYSCENPLLILTTLALVYLGTILIIMSKVFYVFQNNRPDFLKSTSKSLFKLLYVSGISIQIMGILGVTYLLFR